MADMEVYFEMDVGEVGDGDDGTMGDGVFGDEDYNWDWLEPEESIGDEHRRRIAEYRGRMNKQGEGPIALEESRDIAVEEARGGDAPPPPPAAHPEPVGGRARRGRCFAVRVRRETLRVPREPTERDRQDHELHHIPLEDWCESCAHTKSLAKGASSGS